VEVGVGAQGDFWNMDSIIDKTTVEVLQNYGGVENNYLNAHVNNYIDDPSNDLILPSYYYDMDEFKAFLSKENGINILSLNCCSLRAKYDEINIFLYDILSSNMHIDILCVQETWLSSGEDVSHLHISGFNFVSQEKRISGHGGLGIYIRNSLDYKNLDIGQPSNIFESQFIEICAQGKRNQKLILGNIYRPPRNNNDNFDQFTIDFQHYLQILNNKRCPIILAGDYNIDLLQISSKPAFMEVFQMIIACSYIPRLTFPSRYDLNGRSCSLIDNFFVNMCQQTLKAKAGILVHKISDHLLSFINIDLGCLTKTPRHVFIKKSSDNNYANFRHELQQHNLNDCLDHHMYADPNANYDIVNDCLSHLHSKHFPVVKKRFNKSKHFKAPWMNHQILNAINVKNSIYKDLLCTDPTSHAYNELKAQFQLRSKEVRTQIRGAKRSYYASYFHENSNNMIKTWSKINELLGKSNKNCNSQTYFWDDGKVITGDKNIAEAFNNYFTNITTIMANNIDPLDNTQVNALDFLTNRPTSHFDFNFITPDQLLTTANDIKSKNSSGHDKLTTKLIKYIINDIKDPLTVIFNQCIANGVFPNSLKVAKVTPIFKKGDTQLLGNYRPIALLPAISKIFEKLMYGQIMQYFLSNNLLHTAQYGFRKNHSTEFACIELTDRIIKSFEESKECITLFLDLSKAFDLICHKTLIKKMQFYGFTDNAVALCQDYLNNRMQYVVYNSEHSKLKPSCTSLGIPQGSILGPLYFLIYINDFPNASNLFNFIMYADDTTLETNINKCKSLCNVESPNIDDINNVINNELCKIQNWLNINKLILNTNKTKCMIFHPQQRSRHMELPTLKINDQIVDIVTEFNFLGIILDEHMTWKAHSNYLQSKLNRVVGILNRLKHFLDKSTSKVIYHALFTPHINYGILCWGYSKQHIIFKIQKKAIRAITKSPFRAHTEPLFKELQILQIMDVLKTKELKLYYQIVNESSPEYILNFNLAAPQAIGFYDLRRTNVVQPPLARHEYSLKTVRYNMPNTINSTPEINRVYTQTYNAYSIHLKKYCISQYSTACNDAHCYTCNHLR